MRVLVSGSTGFIGSHLVTALQAEGREVLRLVRRKERAAPDEIQWSPDDDLIDRNALVGIDAAVHLTGESIMGRWNEAKKREIRRSRVKTTSFLAEILASLPEKPAVLLAASAVGYYGNRGSEILTEESTPGEDFLAQVCRDWEAATEPAAAAGIRVVNLRFGVVLGPDGGALKQMLTPFRLGFGGPVGDGRQHVSWVSIDDAIGIILFALRTEALSGPVNVVSPNPVTNRQLAQTLGHVLSRPAFVPVPRFALRAAFGDMADETLLASQRVNPRKLIEHEYHYKDPQLDNALRRMLTPA